MVALCAITFFGAWIWGTFKIIEWLRRDKTIDYPYSSSTTLGLAGMFATIFWGIAAFLLVAVMLGKGTYIIGTFLDFIHIAE